MNLFAWMFITGAYAAALSALSMFRESWLYRNTTARWIQGAVLLGLLAATVASTSKGLAGIWEMFVIAIVAGLPIAPWLFLMSIDGWQAWDRARTTTYNGELRDIHRKADLALEQGSWDLAVELLEDALHEYDDKLPTLRKLMDLCQRRGEHARAARYLGKAAQFEKSLNGRARLQMELAEFYIEHLGDHAAAREILERLERMHEGSVLGSRVRKRKRELLPTESA